MRTRNSKTSFVMLLAFLFLALPAYADEAATTDLGTVGDMYSSSGATAINDSGQVVGWSNLTPTPGFDAFLWTSPSGPMANLGNLGGTKSYAIAINDAGQVVGWANDSTGTMEFAFFYDPSSPPMYNMGNLGNYPSYPTAINDAGQVVGWSDDSSGDQHAFFWDPAAPPMVDLGTLTGIGQSAASAMNNSGQVVGVSDVDTSGTQHAFFYDPLVPLMVDLGTLTGIGQSAASAMNNIGQVVGVSDVDTSGNFHAFFWDPAAPTMMVDIGTLGGSKSYPTAINDAGQVVGWSDDSSGDQHAFFWDPAAPTIVDIGTLGGIASNATAINQAGQVVGWSNDSSGDQHAFVWTDSDAMTDLGTLGGSASYATAINNAVPVQIVGQSYITPNPLNPDIQHGILWTLAPGVTVTLTVASTNPGSGVNITVSPNDATNQGNGTTEFTRAYVPSTPVTLMAPPTAASNVFISWNGCDTTSGTQCNVTMNASKTVTANYAPPVTLTVASTNPSSGVNITVSPNDTNNHGNGTTLFQRAYAPGTPVTLMAPPTAGGNFFSSWTGCATTSGVQCNVTVNTGRTVTANYAALVTLTVASTNPSSGVNITVTPTDTNSQGNGTTQFTRMYASGTPVTLTAPPTAGGNFFSNWTGCDTTAGVNCKVTVSTTRTVTANYATSSEGTFTISGVVVTASHGLPVRGVTMTLTGPKNATTTTNSKGKFSFTKVHNGDYVLTPTKIGHTFTSPFLDVSVTGANQTGIDFTQN